MKVIHVVSKFAGGGLERRAIQVIKGLCSQPDIEQCIFVYSSLIEYKEVNTLGVKIYYLKNSDKKSRCQELIKMIKEYRPDIVHSWLDRFPTEQVLLSFLKYIYKYKYIHGAICDGIPLLKCNTIWWGQRISFLCADAIVSNSVAGIAAKKAPLGKSVVIYNGFDFERIPKNLANYKRADLSIKARFLVIMCGRIDVAKDWDSYIEIARQANFEKMDVAFIAVGNGNQIEIFRKQIENEGLNNISFIGRRNDVEDLISISDVCMLLTNSRVHVEGVSNFIMESMALGKPVIATRGGGTPEIITNGLNGFVVDDNKKEAYTCLKELLEDKTKRVLFGEKGIEEIQKRFTLDIQTKQYLKLYQQIFK